MGRLVLRLTRVARDHQVIRKTTRIGTCNNRRDHHTVNKTIRTVTTRRQKIPIRTRRILMEKDRKRPGLVTVESTTLRPTETRNGMLLVVERGVPEGKETTHTVSEHHRPHNSVLHKGPEICTY